MDPHTLSTPSSGPSRGPGLEAAGLPVPGQTEQLSPDANPNLGGAELPRPNEQHNLELPTVVPISPVAPPADAPAAVPMPADPIGVIPLPGMTDPGQSTPVSTDLSADDRDVIEKAWIQKAKAIVEQTRDDPHQQNKEINKIKADYIKKRYNKDIKLSNE